MKILMMGNFGTGWDGSITDEFHISEALEGLGHEVERVSRTELDLPKEHFDFSIIAQWNGYPADIINKLRAISSYVVYWAFDYQWMNKEDWHMNFAKEADLFLSKEMEHIGEYQKMGANFRWLPQDFSPPFLDKTNKAIKKDMNVLFTGSFLPWATERTNHILEVDQYFDLTVHSITAGAWSDAGIKNSKEGIMDRGLPELYARAKVVLSIDHVNSAGYWSDRNAQAMACGAFVLFRYVPYSEIVFGDKVEYYNTIDELMALLDFYVRDDEAREEVAQRGYIHAQNNLMVKHRVKQMLDIVLHDWSLQ